MLHFSVTNSIPLSFSRLPDDIWLVDLDANKISGPKSVERDSCDFIPALPEPEISVLRNHLKQVKYFLFHLTLIWHIFPNTVFETHQVPPTLAECWTKNRTFLHNMLLLSVTTQYLNAGWNAAQLNMTLTPFCTFLLQFN